LGRTKILFTSSLDTPFINEDYRLLSAHCDVDRLTTRGILAPFRILPRILTVDLSYTWFASTYAFWTVTLARAFGKPALVIVGGVDAAKIPEIGYGLWQSPWRSALVRRALRKATRVLVVAPSLKKRLVELAGYAGENIAWVPTGYDSTFWFPEGTKEQLILTVAACEDMPRLRAKGIDFLLRCAARMPETRFVVAGVHERVLRQAGLPEAPNVRFLPFANQEELRRLYQVSRVYCLPSLTEGLPNSLCEAMLCGCVPVATEVGGVPEVLGDVGFRVRYGDVDGMVGALARALGSTPAAANRARSRIAENFPLERREQELLRAVSEALS
jgi:glycosyltransferase involved in cell wall biosynthesis